MALMVKNLEMGNDRLVLQEAVQKKVRDAFTKTFGQIYAQYSKPEKVAYWLIILTGFGAIGYVWVFKLKIF